MGRRPSRLADRRLPISVVVRVLRLDNSPILRKPLSPAQLNPRVSGVQKFAEMSRSGQPPDLKKYMDKKLQIKLNANRMVMGTLRGFDQFMNLVVENTVEVNGNERNDIGTVVIRGNSVVTVEALEPVNKS
ncbi:hypothetical protein CDL15_Pgr002112 [Punica granatum]|uniref:Small nuclear ribonucleoprotein G n=2 Tax=Punica granatum TaxID=22663 RepID=A0A218XC74_PUNGR|nr:hypothetical protein CDL15_Pgr002112 [Punica granatum]PKI38509.1 hypothetical protein CRG98_041074 [Punica granatum]